MNLLRQHLTRTEWALFAVAALAASVAAAELAANQVDPPRHATVLAALSGTLTVLLTSRRTLKRWRIEPRKHIGWGLIGVGLVSAVGFGLLMVSVQIVVPHDGLTLSGDQRILFAVSGLVALGAIGAGLLWFPCERSRGLGRLNTWLDGVIVTAAVFLVARQLFEIGRAHV